MIAATTDFWQTFYIEVGEEMERADAKYGPMPDEWDGLHTIKCELAELERAISCDHDRDAKRKEAVQVAAMAFKFLRDCVYG